VSSVKYELGFYILEDDILHSHCRVNLKSYELLHCSKNSITIYDPATCERCVHTNILFPSIVVHYNQNKLLCLDLMNHSHCWISSAS
jgi:hypothetical protein